MVELQTDLPPAKDDRSKEPRQKSGEPLLVPKGTKLLSRGVEVTSSVEFQFIDELEKIADGNQTAAPYGIYHVELFDGGLQWVQLDLGKSLAIYAVLLWHYYLPYPHDYQHQGEPPYLARVYQDVLIQISNDPMFEKEVVTVFNNDHDNSSGLGKGEDLTYTETSEGLWVDTKGVEGRYVRLYSNGHKRLWSGEEKIPIEKYASYRSTNDYIEVEVYGK